MQLLTKLVPKQAIESDLGMGPQCMFVALVHTACTAQCIMAQEQIVSLRINLRGSKIPKYSGGGGGCHQPSNQQHSQGVNPGKDEKSTFCYAWASSSSVSPHTALICTWIIITGKPGPTERVGLSRPWPY